MFHKIVKLQIIQPYSLLAEYENGISKLYDVEPLFDRFQHFQQLKNGLFQNAAIDMGGYGVVWSDEIDLDAQEIYNNGK